MPATDTNTNTNTNTDDNNHNKNKNTRRNTNTNTNTNSNQKRNRNSNTNSKKTVNTRKRKFDAISEDEGGKSDSFSDLFDNFQSGRKKRKYNENKSAQEVNKELLTLFEIECPENNARCNALLNEICKQLKSNTEINCCQFTKNVETALSMDIDEEEETVQMMDISDQ